MWLSCKPSCAKSHGINMTTVDKRQQPEKTIRGHSGLLSFELASGTATHCKAHAC